MHPRHAWTVHRHLLEACRHAAGLAPRVSRPDLLLLAALLHDLGQGRHEDPDGNHSQRGVVITRQIGRRVGLRPDDLDTLTALVRHHRLLPDTGTHRDPEDPATTHSVIDTHRADPTLLELLAALAEADARGTSPAMRTRWRVALHRDLVGRCHHIIGR